MHKLRRAMTAKGLSLVDFVQRMVTEGSTIRTDGATIVRMLGTLAYPHEHTDEYRAVDKTEVLPGVNLSANCVPDQPVTRASTGGGAAWTNCSRSARSPSTLTWSIRRSRNIAIDRVRVRLHDHVRVLDRTVPDLAVDERGHLVADPELEAAGGRERREHDVHGVAEPALEELWTGAGRP